MLSAMSSSKHQPIPRKRTIDDVTPEFPRRPGFSLKATKEFAIKSQKALRSVPVISSDIPYLYLPRLSPHRLQYRFRVGDDNSVLVMMRKSYPLLKREVDTLDSNYYGIYVRGPVGVGKSYLLYLLAAEYRMNRECYRVTYINDCAEWRSDKFDYILRELVTTFYDDTIGGKSIVQWCQAVTGNDREQKMMKMMKSLVNNIHQKNLQWIVICDQHNGLFNPSVVKDFPFSLINYLSGKQDLNVTVVISASANNEGHPTEMRGWQTHDLPSHRFDQDEFKVWCELNILEDNTEIDHESDEALDALFWTGGIPYELDLLWKQPRKTLIEKTKLYRVERVRDMRTSHNKFYKTLIDKEKDKLAKCISRMALRLSPPQRMKGIDRELLNIIKDDNGHEIITALNPVARRALLGYHGRDLMITLGHVTERESREAYYSNDTTGKICVLYITTMLELSHVFSFQYRRVTNIATGDMIERKRIKIDFVVHFMTNRLPPKTSFQKNATTLFVPDSPNYPRFNFFVWDAPSQVLIGFLVTVQNPFFEHPKMTNSDSEMWQRFCFGNSRQNPMELYWVVPRQCIGEDISSVANDSIILFEDLVSDFPALGKLILQ